MRQSQNYYCVFLVLLFVVLTESISGQSYLTTPIPDSLLRRAYSVIRLDSTFVELKEKQINYHVKRVTTILDKKHSHKQNIHLWYKPGENVIYKLSVTYYDKDGKVLKKVKKKNFDDNYAGQSFELITDSRVLSYSFHSASYPITVDLNFLRVDKSPSNINGWYPLSSFNTSVVTSTIRIDNQVNKEYSFDSMDIDQYEVEKGIHYTAAGLKAKKKEKHLPQNPFSELTFSLKNIAYGKHEGKTANWSDFGTWYYNTFIEPNKTLTREHIVEKYGGKLAGLSKLEQAQYLYNSIQESTRYIAINIEDGGWNPLSTDVVQNKQYGDCKALSLYYHSLLDAFDIESDLVLIYGSSDITNAKEDFYSPNQFNHMICVVRIDGKDLWADLTSKHHPLGYIGQFCDDRKVLRFNNTSGWIETTPSYIDYTAIDQDIELTTEGTIIDKRSQLSQGLTKEVKQWVETYSSKEREAYYKNRFDNYPSFTIDSSHYEISEDRSAINEYFVIQATNIVEQFGEHLLVPLALQELPIPKLKSKKRYLPIRFQREKKVVINTTYNLPDGYSASVKEDVKYNSLYGLYTCTYTLEGSKLIVNRTFIQNKGEYPVKEYKKIRSFFNKCIKAEKKSISLKPIKT